MANIFRFSTPELSRLRRQAEAAGRLLHAMLLRRIAEQSASKADSCGDVLVKGHKAFERLHQARTYSLPLLADRELLNLRSWMRKVTAALTTPETPVASQTPQMIAQDIVALATEFPAVRVTTRFVSVETEEIELEGTSFGPFEIRYWFDPDKRYEVVALEPNCCASDEAYTHPHVNSGCLCEGDGVVSIATARTDGRLFDCLILIRSVLNTYSAETAYCRLDRWDSTEDDEDNSVECADCSDMVNEDEIHSCRRCGDGLCAGCRVVCTVCDSTFCGTHSGTCGSCAASVCQTHRSNCECGETVCDNCKKDCVECGDGRCNTCLDEDGRCPDCVEKAEQEREENNEEQNDSAII